MMKNYEEAEKYLTKAFEEFVPAKGKSETLYGEITRAINRLMYRYWNDGDHLGIGYGKETCNMAGRFLIEKCDEEVMNAILAAWDIYGDDEYESALHNAAVVVANYLENNKEQLIAATTDDMFDYYDKTEDVDDTDDEDEEDYYEDEEYDDEEY